MVIHHIDIWFKTVNFDVAFLKAVLSTAPINTKITQFLKFFGGWFVWISYFILTGALLFDEEVRQVLHKPSLELFWKILSLNITN